MASPAIHPTRLSGWVDPRRPADYPIVLGDSLKGQNSKSKNPLVNIRYNYQPKSGFGSRRSKLTKSGDKYELVVRDDDSEGDDSTIQYSGALKTASATGASDQPTTNLALVFDKSKSVFVLEAISTSLDMNLTSGAGHSTKSARDMPQLPVNDSQQSSADNTQPTTTAKASASVEDEPGDSSNPFDYRHFIAEARESLEKSTQQQQAAGGRTPISGISTPVPPGAGRFVSTTPQFRATHATSKTASTPHQRKTKEETSSSRAGPGHSRTTSSTTAKNASSGKRNTASRPLSKATISDSDSDADSETIDVARLPAPKPTRPSASANTTSSRPKAPVARGHARNLSANIGSSPHIIINDDDGDLEIDMGSPEPEERNRRNRVDPEMFRSHTGTPIGGLSSNFGSAGRPISRLGDDGRGKDSSSGAAGRRDYHRASDARDRDVTMKDIEAAPSPSDEDGDVEAFELGSPQEKRPSSHVAKRRDDSDEENAALAPTPPPPRDDRAHVAYDDDDDEDLLAAELEAALDEEDEASAGIGLGIGLQQSDESEVSEEE